MALKVNLYKGYELEAVAESLASQTSPDLRLDSIMVADSYANTHLGLPSTCLSSEAEQALFFQVLRDLVYEVRLARDNQPELKESCYLIADMPHGTLDQLQTGVDNCLRMLDAGAESIKIEMTTDLRWKIADELTARQVPVLAHLGYTPQAGLRQLHGRQAADVWQLIALACRARDVGASCIILENVSTVVNAALSRPSKAGLPVYSIFSGRPSYAGLSVNVWDCVYQPRFASQFFPPSANRDSSSFPAGYSRADIGRHFSQTLEQIQSGEYPKTRSHRLTTTEVQLLEIHDPWVDARQLAELRQPVPDDP